MYTHALQLMLYFQTENPESARADLFVEAVQLLAQKHGLTLGDHQSMRLGSDDYHIRACDRCAHLTIDQADIGEELTSMLPDFWFHLRRGSVNADASLCNICANHQSAN
jgi:hypothetical protein